MEQQGNPMPPVGEVPQPPPYTPPMYSPARYTTVTLDFPIFDMLVAGVQLLFWLFYCFGWFRLEWGDYSYYMERQVTAGKAITGSVSPAGVIAIILSIGLFCLALVLIVNRYQYFLGISPKASASLYLVLGVLLLTFTLISIGVNGDYGISLKELSEGSIRVSLNWAYYVCLAMAVVGILVGLLKFKEN